MRAAVCSAWGEVESLEVREMPVPEPGEGEVAIRVAAAGVNYADAIMIAGNYQTRPAHPFVPGLEAAGRGDGARARLRAAGRGRPRHGDPLVGRLRRGRGRAGNGGLSRSRRA